MSDDDLCNDSVVVEISFQQECIVMAVHNSKPETWSSYSSAAVILVCVHEISVGCVTGTLLIASYEGGGICFA